MHLIWYGTIQQFYVVSMWRKYLCPPNKRFFNVSFNINEFPRPHKKLTLCRLQYFSPIYYCKLINITNVHYLNNVICVYYDLMHCFTLSKVVNKAMQKKLQFQKHVLSCCATFGLQNWTSKESDDHFKKNHRFEPAEILLLPFFCRLTAILSKRPFFVYGFYLGSVASRQRR